MSSPSKEVRKAYYYRNREAILLKTKEKYIENKESLIQYQRDYRKLNRKLVSEKQKKVRLEKQDALIEFLGGKCAHCGGVYHRSVYDFHHINPDEKEYTISNYMGYSLERLKKEVEKCILLCANCHRRVHSA